MNKQENIIVKTILSKMNKTLHNIIHDNSTEMVALKGEKKER
jgi:hypothetical protein